MSDLAASRLLLAILRGAWEDAERLARDAAPSPGAFAGLCRTTDVAPTVHAILEREGRLGLAGGDADELGRIRAKTRVDNLLLLARLEQALDLLLARGIHPVALKGVDVLHRLYASFDERVLDDVDLLVRPDERDAAIETLEAAGWKGPRGDERTHWLRSSFEMPLYAPGPVTVIFEIHWNLGQEMRYTIDPVALISRALPLDAAGRSIRRLDEHDAVAHLLLHHVQHYFDRRLKWVVELGRRAQAPGFSWTTVAERLRAWGGLGAAGLALAHVRKLFPAMLPDDAYRAIPAAGWRLAATFPLRSRHPLDFYRGTRSRWVQLVLAAAALERPGDLPRYLRERSVRDRR